MLIDIGLYFPCMLFDLLNINWLEIRKINRSLLIGNYDLQFDCVKYKNVIEFISVSNGWTVMPAA